MAHVHAGQRGATANPMVVAHAGACALWKMQAAHIAAPMRSILVQLARSTKVVDPSSSLGIIITVSSAKNSAVTRTRSWRILNGWPLIRNSHGLRQFGSGSAVARAPSRQVRF